MASRKSSLVAIVVGSDSDLEILQGAVEQLREFGIDPVVRIISAHRTPQVAAEFAESALGDGIRVIIAAAGMAAHLAGALASRTTLPVIGVPLAAEPSLGGLDALLSTVQMPGGVPVASMAIGRTGAKNAGLFAVQILALADKGLQERLMRFREAQARTVVEKDAARSQAAPRL